MKQTQTQTDRELDLFTNAYIEALYFTDTGDVDQPPNDAELTEEARKRIEKDCQSFWERASSLVRVACVRMHEDLDETIKQAGHDFHLTRNGHGCGFWEVPDWPEDIGEKLTNLSKEYGETYIGLDERGHICID